MQSKTLLADRFREGKHDCNVWSDQVNLRVISLSQLVDAARVDIGVVNQSVEHVCEYSREDSVNGSACQAALRVFVGWL